APIIAAIPQLGVADCYSGTPDGVDEEERMVTENAERYERGADGKPCYDFLAICTNGLCFPASQLDRARRIVGRPDRCLRPAHLLRADRLRRRPRLVWRIGRNTERLRAAVEC